MRWLSDARPMRALDEIRRDASRGALRLARRQLERALGSGPYRAPLDLARDRVVLLFYEDFDRDRFFKGDRHIKRGLRKIYRSFAGGQRVTGFRVAFTSLTQVLERAGFDVRVNDFALARKNPSYPIGIAGYPHILSGFSLPNPAVLGPGLLDHPGMAPQLMEDPRYKAYLCPSEWCRRLFAKAYGDRCMTWFVGIDTDAWPDLRGEPKDVDFIVYEKVLWNRAEAAPKLVGPILAELKRRGLTAELLSYGRYDYAQYRDLLRRSRGMIFLVEHETQGIACQEAMASNVPILAWDQGLWLDPKRLAFESAPVPASSVPYFGPQCGERFKGLDEFPAALDRFLEGRAIYTPRAFVVERLSMAESARLYIKHYASAGGMEAPPSR